PERPGHRQADGPVPQPFDEIGGEPTGGSPHQRLGDAFGEERHRRSHGVQRGGKHGRRGRSGQAGHGAGSALWPPIVLWWRDVLFQRCPPPPGYGQDTEEDWVRSPRPGPSRPTRTWERSMVIRAVGGKMYGKSCYPLDRETRGMPNNNQGDNRRGRWQGFDF